MKILVVGFPRSGTTLTYRIFKRHPQVERMYFENWLLLHPKMMNNKSFKKGHTVGSKVIYAKRVIGKIGKTKYNIVDYCNDWNDKFKEEAKIIQIVRHPLDSLNSLVISKKRHPRGPSAQSIYENEYFKYIPKYTLKIAAIPNCLTIKYEDLVGNPDEVIQRLYKHCNIDVVKFKEKMKVHRIFNHKDRKFLLPWDDRLKNVVDVFNTLPGTKYKLEEI